ncbi:MAG: hypothetical protein ACKVOR_12250 [Flavobacteriales bacterium]
MNFLKKIFTSALVLLYCNAELTAQFFQGSNMQFGKNRVQYKEFTWFYYPSKNFDVYYYIGGEPLAEYTLVSAERNLVQLEKFFDYTLDEKMQVLTYLKQSEYRQSNLGLEDGDGYNIGGVARIMGNKMFVYYEDDHTTLDLQIRENIARILFNQMMYGGDWKDVLKSSTLLSVPRWYEEGLIAYAAGGPSLESETYISDLLLQDKFKSFNFLEGPQARLAGQAFWNYISEVYGDNVIPNLLYMSQASRNIESGFLYVLGLSLEAVTDEFVQFYKDKSRSGRTELIPGEPVRYDGNDKAQKLAWKKARKQMGYIKVKYKKRFEYSQFTQSPDGKYVAYVTHELGQYRIWIYDTEEQEAECILKREYKLDRIADKTFPALTWHPSSKVLTYVFEKRNNAWIGNYNLEEEKHSQKELFLIQKILDMKYHPDGKKIIFSGVNRGQTDLYLYQVIGNNQEQLTFDIWDDMNPQFTDDGKRIIFSSNRPDDTLRTDEKNIYQLAENHDIYLFELANRSRYLTRLTNTPDDDEQYPAEYSSKKYTYVTTGNESNARYLATIDSAITTIDTTIHYRYYTVTSLLDNYQRKPASYRFDAGSGTYTMHFARGMQPIVYVGNKSNDQALNVQSSGNKSQQGAQENLPASTMVFSKDSLNTGDIDINNYLFEEDRKEYSYEKQTIVVQDNAKVGATLADSLETPFELPRSRNYRLNFAADQVVAQVNNTFTNPFYQLYTSPSSVSPGLSFMNVYGASDLFEDYKVRGGFRFSANLQNNDYGVSFENLRHRWDKKLILSRQSNLSQNDDTLFKTHTYNLIRQWKYPFTELSSVRIQAVVREDRKVALSQELTSLSTPNSNQLTTGIHLEYVFDNTIYKGINLYNGTRYKIWAESYVRPLYYQQRTDFNVVGFDFRHYRKIHRDIIAAIRISGATSFGQYKVVHYLGGVDNWILNQRINTETDIDVEGQRYAYQSFVAPMRGFYVNSRNGNSLLMSNTEIRLPVFKYFMRKPIKSDFVENFQIVGFFDAGSAWTGLHPYTDENIFNQNTVEKNPVTVTVSNNRDPIIYGYGFGLHSRVLGYFVRADWSWGIDDGRVLPRVFYLSLNMDF